MQRHLVVLGLGYCGTATALLARDAGWRVTGTARDPGGEQAPPGIALVAFDDAGDAVRDATHLLATAAPEPPARPGPAVPGQSGDDPGAAAGGDPVLARHGRAIAQASRLRWVGYLSTTGVYGDRGGAWVDEDTRPAPGSERARRRVEAEAAWRKAVGPRLDILRLAGIYGPGRSVFAELREGRARRVRKPGHVFGRIHRDDVAGGAWAAMRQDDAQRPRILNFSDDQPADSASVIGEAARLLGLEPPPIQPFDEVQAGMSPMARSFWAEDRKVCARRTQAMLGYAWRYPSFREGLLATLQEEAGAPVGPAP